MASPIRHFAVDVKVNRYFEGGTVGIKLVPTINNLKEVVWN